MENIKSDSFWLQCLKNEPEGELSSIAYYQSSSNFPTEVEVCVIGGGLTGVSAAYALRFNLVEFIFICRYFLKQHQPDRSVVVFERRHFAGGFLKKSLKLTLTSSIRSNGAKWWTSVAVYISI